MQHLRKFDFGMFHFWSHHQCWHSHNISWCWWWFMILFIVAPVALWVWIYTIVLLDFTDANVVRRQSKRSSQREREMEEEKGGVMNKLSNLTVGEKIKSAVLCRAIGGGVSNYTGGWWGEGEEKKRGMSGIYKHSVSGWWRKGGQNKREQEATLKRWKGCSFFFHSISWMTGDLLWLPLLDSACDTLGILSYLDTVSCIYDTLHVSVIL